VVATCCSTNTTDLVGIPDVACGVPLDGGWGTIMIKGTISGREVLATSVAAFFNVDAGVSGTDLEIVASSVGDVCLQGIERKDPPSSWTVIVSADPTPAVTGVYRSKSDVFLRDQNCGTVIHGIPSDFGKLVLSCLEPVAGSFEIPFPSGDRLSGEFVAPICSSDLSVPQTCGNP
jgi:hypothetical protein